MLDLLNHNKKILQKYIDYWEGKTIKGKPISESGINGMFFNCNVKRFLKKGEDFKEMVMEQNLLRT